jgi:hypothetical protein
MSDPRNDYGTGVVREGIVPRLKNRIVELERHNSELKVRVTKAEAMLKALDVYWKLHPDSTYNMTGNCPLCEKPNPDSDEHENCFEDAWDRFAKLRKEFEGGGK